MRLTELFASTLVEDTSRSGRQLIQMSMADLYDMTGQPYPLIEDPDTGVMVVPPNFYEKRQFGIGEPDANNQVESGSIHPDLARGYNAWVAGGKMPGLIQDANGDIRPYNDNWYVEDFAWRLASGTFELGANITRGVASGVDGLWNLVGGSGKPVTGVARQTFLDDAAEWLDSNTDLDFRDQGTMMATAVTDYGDLLGLVPGMGDTRSQMSWAGFGAMFATELPSTMLDIGVMAAGTAVGGPVGFAAATGALASFNAAEASGAAVLQISDVVDANYESGELQKTYQWSAATQLARAQLEYDGVIVPGAELTEIQQGQLDDLAKQVILTNTYNAVLPAVAASAGTLDTAADLLLFNKLSPLSPSVIRNTVGRWVVSPQVEGFEEAFQEVWTQRGLVNEAGDLNSEWANAVNAYYQGVVIGTGEAGMVTATDTIQGLNREQQSRRAQLRQFFYGADAGNLDTIIDLAGTEPELLMNNILSDEGRLALAQSIRDRGLITDINQKDENGQYRLNRFQRMRVRAGLTVELDDGTEVSRDIISQNARKLDLLSVIDNMSYDPSENKYNVEFASEADLLDAASLLGIDTEGPTLDFKGRRRLNQVMRELEEVYKLDFRVIDRSNLEAPTWTDLSAAQKAEFVNRGYVDFTQESDGNRIGQRWTRADIERSSRRYGDWDNVPEEIRNVAEPVVERPTLENQPELARELQSAQDALASFATAAERNLQQAQLVWDRAYGDDPENAPRPRPDETDTNYQNQMQIARGEIGQGVAYKQRVDQITQGLAQDQQAWDAEYARTHNRNGTPRLQSGIATADGFINQTDPATPDQRRTDDGEPNDTGEEPITPITPQDLEGDDDAQETTQAAPVQPDMGSDLARGYTVYNTRLRLADGELDPMAVASMVNNLEKTYPGITQEIFGEGGIESYRQNPQQVIDATKEELNEAPPQLPAQTQASRPKAGTEIEVSGEKYRFLGRMWAPVKEDGSLGSTGAVSTELQQQLTSQALGRTTPTMPMAAERAEDTPEYTNPTRPEVQTQIENLPEYEEGDAVEYRNATGETRSAEFVRNLPNGNIQVTLNGATYAITPANIAAAQVPPAQEPKTADNNFGLGVVDPGLQRAIQQRAQNAADAGGIDNLPVDDGTPNDTGAEPEVREPTGSGRGDGQLEVDARRAEREAAQQIIANQAADAEERSVRDSVRDEAKRIAAEREAEAQELAIRDSIRDQAAREAQRMNAAEEETANREVIQNIAKKIASDNNAAEQESEIRDQIIQRAEDLANQSKEFGDAAAEELAVRNSIRDAAKEAAAAAKAEAEEAAQREAIRTAAEERAAEIAAQNQLVDDNEQDIRDEIRRRAEEEANLAAERREAEIRQQIEDQIKSIEDAEAQQQAAQANDKDGDLTTRLDTKGETPPVPQPRPAAPVPTPQARPEAPARDQSTGRGDGDAEVARRKADQEAETRRQAQLRQQELFRQAQQRIRAADQAAQDAQSNDIPTPITGLDIPDGGIPDSKLDRRLVGNQKGDYNTTNVNIPQARREGLPYVVVPVTGARDEEGNVQVGKVYGTNDELSKKYPGQRQFNTVKGSSRGDGQAELDARRRAQQDIDSDTQQDSGPVEIPDTPVTQADFDTDTTKQTGITPAQQVNTMPTTTAQTKIAPAQQRSTDKDAETELPLPIVPGGKKKIKKDLKAPDFPILTIKDPLNLDRYKSFGDSVQDTRKPVNEKKKVDEITNIRALTPDQRDAIGGYGDYKYEPIKPTSSPRQPKRIPGFKKLDIADPMNLDRYKNFESKKNKR